MYEGIRVGQWRGSEPNVMSLPRSEGSIGEYVSIVGAFDGFNYEELERRVVADLMSLQVGDPVIYDDRHEAHVVAWLPNGEVKISFDEKGLIPPTMSVGLERLTRPGDMKKCMDPRLGCPKCGVYWKETPGFRFNFFDCPGCGAKKEDHVNV